MISSKILVQSAAAGLMAGAILTSPLFVFGPEDSSPHSSPSPSRVEYRHDVDHKKPQARFEHPVLRAAPQHAHLSAQRVRVERVVDPPRSDDQLDRRSLEERNRAANQALQQINKAYEHSRVQQRRAQHHGARVAHSVRLHSLATQAATRVYISSNNAAQRGQTDCDTGLRRDGVLEQRGPVLLPAP